MTAMRKIFVWFVRGLWLVLLLTGITLFINLPWFDEPLHPDVARILEPTIVPLENNAYPLMLAFTVASDADWRARGSQAAQLLVERHARGEPVRFDDDEFLNLVDSERNGIEPFHREFPSLRSCDWLENECVDLLLADLDAADLAHPRLGVLLDRWEALLDQTRFHEFVDMDIFTPNLGWTELLAVSRIRLALSYRDDTTEVFIAKLAEDAAFWVMLIEQSRTLLSTTVPASALRLNMRFVSHLVRTGELSDDDLNSVRLMLGRLLSVQPNPAETYYTELRFLANTEALLGGKGDESWVRTYRWRWLASLTIQRNATLNDAYLGLVLPLIVRAADSPREAYARRDERLARIETRFFPPPLFNFGGKLLLEVAGSSYTNFVRIPNYVHDAKGYIALAQLQIEISTSPQRGVSEVIRTSSIVNPYTGQPMNFDPQTRTIWFDCLGRRNTRCGLTV